MVCKSGTRISVVHKGNGDLNTHLQLEKHRKAVRGAVALTKMTNYFVTAGSKCEDEITAAGGTLAFHAVRHHHHSFLSMDCTSVLLKKIFPDSEKRMLLKKCVAFTGDNCNTMFGGLQRNEQGNNVFAKLKKMLNSSLIGVGTRFEQLYPS